MKQEIYFSCCPLLTNGKNLVSGDIPQEIAKELSKDIINLAKELGGKAEITGRRITNDATCIEVSFKSLTKANEFCDRANKRIHKALKKEKK